MTEQRRTWRLPGDWNGLRCQECKEPLRKVDRTRRTAGFVVRERICTKCGCKNKTFERVVESR